MRGFAHICSNEAERLADALAAELSRPPEGGEANPLRLDWVVVPNPMTQHWLMEALARRLGVAAGIRFMQPRAFVELVSRAFAAEETAPSVYDRGALVWPLYARLGEGALPPEPAHFLGDESDLKKRYRLASDLADLFDQYGAYRPEMLAAWKAGRLIRADDPREAWQAALWRDVCARVRPAAGDRPLYERLSGLPERLQAAGKAVPGRVCVCGVSHLSPLYWEALSAYAQVGRLCLFAFQPTPDFWVDLTDEKRRLSLLARERSRRKRPDLSEADLFLPRGAALLGALGRQGQDFFKQLCDHSDSVAPDEAFFVRPAGERVLARLQAECYAAFAPEEAPPTPPVRADDDSVRLHVCHSPWREAQVLRDAILSWLEKDPSLRPGDIRVYVTDLAAYAPALRAVFARADRPDDIPLSIADPLFSPQDDAGEALFRLLGLAHAPASFSQVADILQLPPVARALGLEPEDFDNLRRWAVSLNIRWGRDGEHLARQGASPQGSFSWRAGLDRLLVGTLFCDRAQVFADDVRETFSIGETAGLIPSRAAGAAHAESAGRIAHAVDQLFAAVERWEKIHTGARWRVLIASALSQFFPDEAPWEASVRRLREAARDLEGQAADLNMDVRVVCDFLRRQGREYLFARQGGLDAVTVCELRAEKIFPARAVCLLGLSEGAFPRAADAPSFDLMAAHPRAGDRAPRQADRYAFLQALLAGRERVHLSYVGRNVKDNGPHKAGERLPASLLVDELESALLPYFPHAAALRRWFYADHPLQPFSPRYQAEGPLFTYAADVLPQPLPAAPLPLPEPASSVLSLEALIDFLLNPAKAFLKARDIALPYESAPPEETETFDMTSRQEGDLGALLLALGQSRALPDLRARAAVAGFLPDGAVGASQWQSFAEGYDAFQTLLADYRPGGPARACPSQIDTPNGPLRLETPLELVSDTLILPRYGPIQARERLRAWLTHNFAAAALDAPVKTLAIGLPRDAKTANRRYLPVPPAQAREWLAGLIALRAAGLKALIPFAPKTALAYKEAKPDEALNAAQKAWEGTDFYPGESANPYQRLCWPQSPVAHPRFVEYVEKVFKNFTEEVLA